MALPLILGYRLYIVLVLCSSLYNIHMVLYHFSLLPTGRLNLETAE